MANKKTVEVLRGRGKRSKEFRFKLLASNGQVIAIGEFYKRKLTLKKMLVKNFAAFEIDDQT